MDSYHDRYGYDPNTGALINKPAPEPVVAPQAMAMEVEHTAYTSTLKLAMGTSLNRATASSDLWGGEMVSESLWGRETFASWGNTWSAGYTDNSQMERAQIIRARFYWKKDPLIFKCTRLLSQLSNSSLVWDCDDDDTKVFFETWYEQAMGPSFRSQWFTEFFRSGFVPAFKTLVEYVPRDYKSNKTPSTPDGMVRAVSEKSDAAAHAIFDTVKEAREVYLKARASLEAAQKQGVAKNKIQALSAIMIEKQYAWLQGLIPGGYALLDPLVIEVTGPAGLDFLKQPFMRVDGAVATAIKTPTPQQAAFIDRLPVEMVDQIRAGAQTVWLSPNMCYISYNDKMDYERYPTPMAVHAFAALAMKDLLISADERTARGIKDRILKVTIGDEKFPVLDNKEIDQVKSHFNNPSKSLTIFWNHTLKIEWIEMDATAFMDKDKYNVWNNEIRTCYGISQIFTGTSDSSGAIGNSMMNFEGLKQEVLQAQEIFMEFLKNEIRLVRQALGISKEAKPRFVNIFGDIVEFMAGLQSMVAAGNMDVQTLTETLGFDFNTIKRRMKELKTMRADGLFLPVPSANNMGPDGGIPTGGKPAKQAGADNNKNKRGKSQPKLQKAAAARLVVPEPDTVVLTVDCDTLTDGDREELMGYFQLATASQVMTHAEYKQAYNREVVFVQPWPELTSPEVVVAARASAKIIAEIDRETEEACDKWVADQKIAQGEASKKAPYLRADRRNEIRAGVVDTHVKSLACDDPHWDKRMGEAVASLADTDMNQEEIAIHAAVGLRRRWEKMNLVAPK